MKSRLSLAIVVGLSIGMGGQETRLLDESRAIDIVELMERNKIFVSRVQGVEFDNENSIFILDDASGNILRMDLGSGALIKKISSLGQGPSELMMPSVIRVLNSKIFVLCEGYKGVKIFSLDGDLIKSFKTNGVPRWMDVDSQENVYVAEAGLNFSVAINNYGVLGNRVKTVMVFPASDNEKDKARLFMSQMLKFRLDSHGNVVALFYLKRELTKLRGDGNVIWTKTVDNAVLSPFIEKEKVNYDKSGRPIIRFSVTHLDIDQGDNIIIGHLGGGCIYSPDGKITSLLVVRSTDKKLTPPSMHIVKPIGDKLFVAYHDGAMFLFPFKSNL